jgi:CRP/FNR family cyclic AMP-dependent transcriptional regulator
MNKELTPPATVSTLLLKNVPLFATLPEDQLLLLTKVVSREQFSKNQIIFSAGEKTEMLYVVISGRLKVAMGDDQGKEVVLAMLGPGEYFGEMALLDGGTRSASVIAVAACELLCLSKYEFTKFMENNFSMNMMLIRGLVKRLREADKKISSLALMDVYGRVARLLLEMAETIDGQRAIVKKIARKDIANMIGASREMVTRVMKDLETRGMIEIQTASIILKDTLTEID